MGLVLPEEGRHFIYFKVLAIWTAQWLQSHLNHYMKLSANNSYKKKVKITLFVSVIMSRNKPVISIITKSLHLQQTYSAIKTFL